MTPSLEVQLAEIGANQKSLLREIQEIKADQKELKMELKEQSGIIITLQQELAETRGSRKTAVIVAGFFGGICGTVISALVVAVLLGGGI